MSDAIIESDRDPTDEEINPPVGLLSEDVDPDEEDPDGN